MTSLNPLMTIGGQIADMYRFHTGASKKEAMEKAGCKITVSDIGKSENLFSDCVKYSPYMRKRLTLLRLKDMIKPAE